MSSGYFATHCPYCSQLEDKPVFSAISYWAKHPHHNVPLFLVCPRCGYTVTTNLEGETVYGREAARVILETHTAYAEVQASTIDELLNAVVAPSVLEKLEQGYSQQKYIPINTVEDVINNSGFQFNADSTSCVNLDEILI